MAKIFVPRRESPTVSEEVREQVEREVRNRLGELRELANRVEMVERRDAQPSGMMRIFGVETTAPVR